MIRRTTDDYIEAAKLIAACDNRTLPIMLYLLDIISDLNAEELKEILDEIKPLE